jgi:hypothetical protein
MHMESCRSLFHGHDGHVPIALLDSSSNAQKHGRRQDTERDVPTMAPLILTEPISAQLRQ